MYYIRKTSNVCYIRNYATGATRYLNAEEVLNLLQEFPCLKTNSTVTYFRNRVRSVSPLP